MHTSVLEFAEFEKRLKDTTTRIRREKNDQMSNRATAPGQRQCPPIHSRTLTKHDPVRHHSGAADRNAFLTEDGSPERRNLDVGAEDGEQVGFRSAPFPHSRTQQPTHGQTARARE